MPPPIPPAEPLTSRRDRVAIAVSVVLSVLVVASCFLFPYLFNHHRRGGGAADAPSGGESAGLDAYAEEESWLEGNKSFTDALDAVMRSYYRQPDEDHLMRAAARGISRLMGEGASEKELTERGITTMIDALDDPFSAYMDQKALNMLDVQLAGKFFGIGVSMTASRNEIRVQEVLKGTPAEAAGIQENDIVFSVDGTEVTGMDINDVVAMIRGQEGTGVVIGVKRSGTPGVISFDLVRAEIKLPVITTELKPGSIAYIQLTDWNKEATALLAEALEGLKARGARGLVLDLRSNTGGLMDSAIKSADLFLSEGNIVSSRGRVAGSSQTYNATPEVVWEYPVVILTNRGTASSSEIFSAALRDNDRAVLVGETTFGKGEIQQLQRQPDGTALRITVALYFTPAGTSINDEGITPDVLVAAPVVAEGGEDPQLDEAERLVAAMMHR